MVRPRLSGKLAVHMHWKEREKGTEFSPRLLSPLKAFGLCLRSPSVVEAKREKTIESLESTW